MLCLAAYLAGPKKMMMQVRMKEIFRKAFHADLDFICRADFMVGLEGESLIAVGRGLMIMH